MNKLLKDGMLYLFSTIFVSAVNFALIPIFTRVLEPSEYGVIGLFTVYHSFLAAFIGMSVIAYSNRKYFDSVDNKQLVSTSIFSLVLMTSVCLPLVFILSNELRSILNLDIKYLILGCISAFCQQIFLLRLAQWQVKRQPLQFSLAQISIVCLNLFLSLFLVLYLDLKSEGRILAICSANIVSFIFSCAIFFWKKEISLSVDKLQIKELFAFCLPLYPHVIGGVLLVSIDRVLLNKFLTLEFVGIYMVAVTFSNICNLVFNSLNKAYLPWLYSSLKKCSYERKIFIVKQTYLSLFLLVMLSVLSFNFSEYIIQFIVGSEYKKASEIASILISSQFFVGKYMLISNYIFYSKNTKYLSLVTVFCGFVNFVLMCFLIPVWGVYGAAYSSLFSNALMFLSTWAISAYVYPMPWFWFVKK